jgi:hypothetical protein
MDDRRGPKFSRRGWHGRKKAGAEEAVKAVTRLAMEKIPTIGFHPPSHDPMFIIEVRNSAIYRVTG